MTKPFNLLWEQHSKDFYKDSRVTKALLRKLDKLNSVTGGALVVHCLFDEDRGPNNYHYKGMACDLHIIGMHPVDQFLTALEVGFTGIGIYPVNVWHNSGIHVDIRSIPYKWVCRRIKNEHTAQYVNKYVKLDANGFRYIFKIMP